MLGNSGEAMLFYKQAFDRVSKDEIRSDCLTNMADIYRLQGNHEKALACAQQAVELGQRTGDQSREAKGLEYLGLTYISCKRYDEGIDCYKQALQLRQETANLPRIAMVLAFLAFALTNRGSQQDLKQALQYHKQAYEIELKLQNRQSIARYFGDVAVLYNKLGEYEKAIENSEMALHYNEDMGFLRGAALNHVRLAHSYQGLGQLDRMLFHVEKALELEKYLTAFDRNLSRFIEVLIASVRYLHKLGRGLKAKEYAELVINLFKDSEDSDALEGIEQLLKQLERDD
jgi:tetratricopeptide (TPR) repeat protein